MKRLMLSLVVLGVTAMAGSACTASGGTELASATSNVRPEGTGLGLEDFGLEDFGLEDFGIEGFGLEEFGQDIEEFFGGLFDGFEDFEFDDVLPEGAEAGLDCAELAFAYTGMFLEALGGTPASEIEATADEIRPLLPESLHDELDTMLKAAIEVAESDPPRGGELASPEYSQADKAITDFLANGCEGDSFD